MNKTFKFLTVIMLSVSLMASCNTNYNNNLINKVNAIDNQWINYNGVRESNNKMVSSQFIPYHSKMSYNLNRDAYISYYNGQDFIKTILHEDEKTKIKTLEEADGIILSFNKENKNGIKLIKED